jgi:tetratricopeptide (TPR) repeat protein
MGCVSRANPQEEIQITTKSDEARKIFLEARQMQENLRRDEARKLFSKAIEEDSDFALAHLHRALTGTSAMDFQKHLQHAVALKSKISEGERLRIEVVEANANNNPLKSIELQQQLVQMYPKDKRARSGLGSTYYFRQDYDMAISHLEKAIEIDKGYAAPYNMLGYSYKEKGDYAKAEEAFKNYIRVIPDEANPHDSIADLYTKMGRHEDAIKHYKKALELYPAFTSSQRKIGSNLVLMGKYDEGREAYRKAMEIGTTPAVKLTNMQMIAYSYLHEGKYQEALAETDKALKLATEAGLPEMEAGIHSVKCRIYTEIESLDKAEQSLAECKKVVMGSDLSAAIKENFAKGALFDEALIAAKRKDHDQAMARANEYKAKIEEGKDPKEIEDHHALVGYIYFEKGNYAKAIEHLKQADQENPYTLYVLADAESQAGNKAQAAELFSKVADLNWILTTGAPQISENSLNFAFVRSKARMAVKKQMAGKN